MKESYSKTKNKKTGRLSFFLVMLLCTAMIGASCWFAYTQTTKDIAIDLESVLEQNSRISAAVPETGVTRPVQTEKPTEQAETAAAVVPAVPSTTAQTFPETAAPTDPPETETAEPYEYVPTAATPSRLPCNGEILQEYSDGELVKSATTGIWQTHNGIDIAADPGDPVYPMDPGVIMTVEEDALWGVCVTIDHKNGIYSKYCGLHPGLSVTEGDAVTNNEPIGNVGNLIEIENALPSHLHFELRQGDVLIDPIAYLSNDFSPTETTEE